MKVYDTCMHVYRQLHDVFEREQKAGTKNSYSTTNKKFHSFTVLEHRCLWEKKLPFNPQKTTDICVIHQYCGGVGLLFSSQFFPALFNRWREVRHKLSHVLQSVYHWFGGWKYWICMYIVSHCICPGYWYSTSILLPALPIEQAIILSSVKLS